MNARCGKIIELESAYYKIIIHFVSLKKTLWVKLVKYYNPKQIKNNTSLSCYKVSISMLLIEFDFNTFFTQESGLTQKQTMKHNTLLGLIIPIEVCYLLFVLCNNL